MLNEYFSYAMVDGNDVKFYGAIADTIKITSIKNRCRGYSYYTLCN